tara:strand:+ start:132 stop:1124 length:993 start_codon:yes stop_codon:yes gene_type:complete
MKLNTYSIAFFLIIFVILYPLTYYFSEIKLSQKNKSEIQYYYDVWGFLNIKNIDNIIKNSKDEVDEINKKYFGNSDVFAIHPKQKSSGSFKVTIPNNEYFDINKPSQPYLFQNTDLILTLNDNIIFHYDLMNLYRFFKNELAIMSYDEKKFSEECANISQKFGYLSFIDYSTSEFRLGINQKQSSADELDDNDLIFKLFQNCFEHEAESLLKILISNIDNYFILNDKTTKNLLNEFISKNINLFNNQKNIENFKNDTLKIYNDLRDNFQKIDKDNVEFKYSKSKIIIEENFQKIINIYALSFILSIMIALIIFYLFFFLSKKLTFLNKIF